MPRSRRGFTLVEVTVALALAALVVLLAHRVYGGVLDGSVRLADARARLDRAANARRLLASVVGSLEVGTADAGGFSGGPEAVSFAAWRTDGTGAPSLRHLTLGARDGALVLEGLGPAPVPLADSVGAVGVDYLLDLGADTRWMRSWVSALSAPAALRLRVSRPGGTDTLLLVVGPRG